MVHHRRSDHATLRGKLAGLSHETHALTSHSGGLDHKFGLTAAMPPDGFLKLEEGHHRRKKKISLPHVSIQDRKG